MRNKIKNEKGVSLYLSIVILAILLAISLGLNTILISQIKMIRGIEESVIAFYAADTGIETKLNRPGLQPPFEYSGYLDLNGNGTEDPSDAAYTVVGTNTGFDGCEAPRFCIKSKGIFRNVQRAIKVEY